MERWIWVKFEQNLTLSNISEISKAKSSWVCFLCFPSSLPRHCFGLRTADMKEHEKEPRRFSLSYQLLDKKQGDPRKFHDFKGSRIDDKGSESTLFQ